MIMTIIEKKGVQEVLIAEATTQTSSESVSVIDVRIDKVVPLEGERYPALVQVWDNDDDAIYDQV